MYQWLEPTDQSESTLKDCFDHADWDMFQSASENNINLYADLVSEFIRKCIGYVLPTVCIKSYPNQKPWMDGGIRAKLKSQTTAFNHGKRSGNMAEYKQCSYSLCKAIKQAKRQYRYKVESQFNCSDTTFTFTFKSFSRRSYRHVAGSTGNHGLQEENQPHHASRQTKHLCPLWG
jgi:hypothetical protein